MNKYILRPIITGEQMQLMKRIASAIAILLLCSPFLALFTCPVEAEPGTVRVPQNFPTIQQAIDASAPGGTVLVSAGTYSENITVWKPLTITGEKRDTTIIEQVGAFAVCYITADSVNFTGFTIRGGSVGIWVDASDYDRIADNVVTNNDDGIWTTFSLETVISDNLLTDNVFMGLYLSSSNGTTVRDNVMANNTYGIYMENAVDNSIRGNTITMNYADGADIINSQHNSILHNMISNNSLGIYLESSNSNSLYQNNMVDNLEQASAAGTANVWDNGYPSGGNYWSDYSGSDAFSGPNQNQPGSDGIGDTPYNITGNNQDRYPLMQAWTNLAVTRVQPSKTAVGPGYDVYITVTLQNQGWNAVTTTLKVYANATVVSTVTNTVLAATSQAALEITWHTTGAPKGNYIINATAESVTGERDVTDNSLAYGSVVVSIAGDVTGNGVVDIYDAIRLSNAFLSVPGDSNWSGNADINSDNAVDIYDAIILSNNFLKTA